MRCELIGLGDVANGYFGKRTNGAWVFDPESGKTLFVWSGGWFGGSLTLMPPSADAREAEWTLRKRIECGMVPYGIA